MDINDIRRRAEGARTVHMDHARAGQPAQRFTFRLPTTHETQLATARCRAESEGAGGEISLLMMRRLMVHSLVQWQGVTEDDLATGAGPAPADPPVPESVGLLLDADEDRATAIEGFFINALHARNVKQDAAAKN